MNRSVEDELKGYGLSIRQSDAPDREEIDFSIEDEGDNVCWVWGKPADPEWECWHPYQCIEFGDDDELGECKLCGSHCEWHYEDDGEGHKERIPHDWFALRQIRGLIAKIVKEERSE